MISFILWAIVLFFSIFFLRVAYHMIYAIVVYGILGEEPK